MLASVDECPVVVRYRAQILLCAFHPELTDDSRPPALLAAMTDHGVDRLVLASSMVVYGEGRYACAEHGDRPRRRGRSTRWTAGDFENHCPDCGRPLDWAARRRGRPARPAQQLRRQQGGPGALRLGLGAAGRRRGRRAEVPQRLRPRDAPDTPYSGVAAMFRSSLERGESPRVFEDGGQMRDFVHVADVARANVLAIRAVVDRADGGVRGLQRLLGDPVSIAEVAGLVAARHGGGTRAGGDGGYRLGDVRHVVASPDRRATSSVSRPRSPPRRG